MSTRLPVLLAALLSLSLIPRWLCGAPADGWLEGDEDLQAALADDVAAALLAHPGGVFYRTGVDGQSAVAIYQMALLGLGQVVLAHPERAEDYLPAMRAAADQLVAPGTLQYAAERYGRHGAVAMGPGEGHAYMGYINMGLGMLRAVDPDTPHADLNDRLTARLAARLDASPHGMVETYPGETWPPDVAAVAGSIGLHALATGADHRQLLDTWAERFAACSVHSSGYLVQRLRTGSCEALDAPRGSGTALGACFIRYAHPALADRLTAALRDTGLRSALGFGALREYAPGFSGAGDTNAGPIVLGLSVGATGFGLGAARASGDRDLFTRLYRTTHLFGAPIRSGDRLHFAPGGVLGNALLLAMLTAGPP